MEYMVCDKNVWFIHHHNTDLDSDALDNTD